MEQTEDLEVVGEAASVAEALAMDRAHTPDVLVVDINLGGGSGIDVVRQVRDLRPDAGIVVLTMYDEDEHLLAALEAGASSFVLKQRPSDDVVEAVRRAASSPGTFTADGLAAAMRRRMASPPGIDLTSRESDVLALLAQGLSIAEVSARLYVSVSTTKTYMARLYDKLGAANRSQALMAAVRLGLVTPES